MTRSRPAADEERRDPGMDQEPVEPDASGGVAAVDRAFSIVAAVESANTPIGLSEIARRTGLYKSTILRLMVSLERAGYITRLSEARYGLGPAVWRLGLAYERSNPFKTHIEPLLHHLVDSGTESASFHIRAGPDSRLCLLRVDSHHATLDRVQAGGVLPMRGAAATILAEFEHGYRPTAESRIALSYGERDPACAGLATPVFGAGDQLQGALSLSGPRERFTDETVARMRDLLLRSAERATLALGGSSFASIEETSL